MRHKRRDAFKNADFVLFLGVPADFRVNYGRQIPGRAWFGMINLDPVTLRKNSDIRGRDIRVKCDPSCFVIALGKKTSERTATKLQQKSVRLSGTLAWSHCRRVANDMVVVCCRWGPWFELLNGNQQRREDEIKAMIASESSTLRCWPTGVCQSRS